VKKRDAALDGLLARGRLSAPQRERIWTRLRRPMRVREGLSWAKLRLALAAPIVATTVFVLVIHHWSDRGAAFQAKGRAASSIEVDCDGAPLGACPTGSKLIFRHGRTERPTYLEAYAVPLQPGGERIWYFPAHAGVAPRLGAADEGEVLRDAIILGPEHVAGDYEIHLLVSTRPLDRREATTPDSATLIEKAVIPLRVVPR
jgi:hypothetical protein